MTFLASSRVNYPSRIARAESLSMRFPFATEILSFYAKIAAFQGSFHEGLPKAWGKRPIVPPEQKLRSELNLPAVLGRFEEFLALVQNSGPTPLAAESQKLHAQGKAMWARALEQYWQAGLYEAPRYGAATGEHANPLHEFLGRAYLTPYAEFVAGAMLPPNLPMTVCRCPRCNSLPVLGVLRPEGDGGKRFLVCAFCSQEWEFRRILCAYCGEEREDHLPVYVSEEMPHIRVESCQTCKHYLRSIDLTKDGNAVPLVDDLAAVPLGLWAEKQGLSRIQSNLLGT